MADGAHPPADSCVKALRAFVENGKALLDLAEKESREGRLQRFVGTHWSACKNRHADAVFCSWRAIYGRSLSGGAAGGLSIITHKEWSPNRLSDTNFIYFISHRLPSRIHQAENPHRAKTVTAGSDWGWCSFVQKVKSSTQTPLTVTAFNHLYGCKIYI